MTDSADPDQLASAEANWSGSTLFAKTRHVMFSKRRVKGNGYNFRGGEATLSKLFWPLLEMVYSERKEFAPYQIGIGEKDSKLEVTKVISLVQTGRKSANLVYWVSLLHTLCWSTILIKISASSKQENEIYSQESFVLIFMRWNYCKFNILLIWYGNSKDNQLSTLKMPRKTTSENVICSCLLLHLLANFSSILFAYRQTVWTQIRLLLEEQSDLGPHCLQEWLLK